MNGESESGMWLVTVVYEAAEGVAFGRLNS